MGQAKRRGTFEERQAAAMNKQKSEQFESDRRADLAYNERQRQRPRVPAGALALAMLSVSLGLPVGHKDYK